MGGRSPFMGGGRRTCPMMGGFPGYPRQGMPPPFGMGMRPGAGMGFGMGMDMGMGGMGMGMGMGMGGRGMRNMPPHLGMPVHRGQSPFTPTPLNRQRHSPLNFGAPGPPRAHSMSYSLHHNQSPYARQRRSPFTMFDDDDDDDMDSDYDRRGPRRMDGRRYPPRQRFPSRQQFRSNPYDDSEDEFDEFDEYEDWNDEFEDESEFEEYYPRRQGYERQWARY
jgi:hypothetical protein